MILISGPCVIENARDTIHLAMELKEIAAKFKEIDFYFKASFDKANRTSINSFRGIGIDSGLETLKSIKSSLGIRTTTDVHECHQVKAVAEVVDMIQIPAFLCRQTDLITAVAKTGKTVNVKKGQFMAPWDMGNIIKKIRSQGNDKIILTERGTCFGYNNLVFDVKSIPIMASFGYPLIIDASHSTQKPSAGNDYTTGDAQFIQTIARAGIAAGANGVFIEVHQNPKEARCDKDNCLDIDELKKLIDILLRMKRGMQ